MVQSQFEKTKITALGTEFEVPAGFSAVVLNNGLTLQLRDPNDALEIFAGEFVGDNLLQSIEQIWDFIDPAFSYKVRAKVNPEPSIFWDEILILEYHLDDQGRDAWAVAKRFDDKIFVTVERGFLEDMNKHHVEVNKFFASIKGRPEENLSKKFITSVSDKRADFVEMIQKTMALGGIPGLSIAVVEGSETVFLEGFGVLSKNDTKSVDADTQMMIGSCSKIFTSALVGILVDEGLLAWSTKVSEILPEVAQEFEAVANLSVEELLQANKDFSRKDLVGIFGDAKDSFFEELKNLELKKSTETSSFNNYLYTLAGLIAQKVASNNSLDLKTYQDLVVNKIFAKTNMIRSGFLPIDENYAVQHARNLPISADYVVSSDQVDSVVSAKFAPAAGIWSCAKDLAEYLKFELNSDNKNILYRREKATQRSASDFNFSLGFVHFKNKSLLRVGLDGGTMGFSSIFLMFPEKRLGVSILANAIYAHGFLGAIVQRLVEIWFSTNEGSFESLKFWTEKTAVLPTIEQSKLVKADLLMNQFLGKHFNQELGTFEIFKSDDLFRLKTSLGEALLVASNENNQLLFKVATPPLNWLALVPNEKLSFSVFEQDTAYHFEKTA